MCKGLLGLVFFMSSVCDVFGLLYLVFVCLGFIMSSVCLSRVGHGTMNVLSVNLQLDKKFKERYIFFHTTLHFDPSFKEGEMELYILEILIFRIYFFSVKLNATSLLCSRHRRSKSENVLDYITLFKGQVYITWGNVLSTSAKLITFSICA